MNAHWFSATAPESVSGSSLGYPVSATIQYQRASQPRMRSPSCASGPNREPKPDMLRRQQQEGRRDDARAEK